MFSFLRRLEVNKFSHSYSSASCLFMLCVDEHPPFIYYFSLNAEQPVIFRDSVLDHTNYREAISQYN